MIVDERIITYINSLCEDSTEFLNTLERQAREIHVPVIHKEMQSLLKVLLALKRPENILEVGTAVGFSALFMCEYAPRNCHITTIENYEKRIPIAKENFKKAGKTEQITLLEGDAADILKEINQSFDFVFMDAAKGQYLRFLPEISRILCTGGVLLSDNVLQDGDIVESRFVVSRRNRTIHSRMREYLHVLSHHPDFTSTVLPIGDGVIVSIKERSG